MVRRSLIRIVVIIITIINQDDIKNLIHVIFILYVVQVIRFRREARGPPLLILFVNNVLMVSSLRQARHNVMTIEYVMQQALVLIVLDM